MTLISRRDVLAGLAATGVGSLASGFGESGRGASSGLDASTSCEVRRSDREELQCYFAENGPKLLRHASGILKYSSIAPSLPGNEYPTQLWDWDTLWTSRGLFRLAALMKDVARKSVVGEHVTGSLINFLDHPSVNGRLPILMSPTYPDVFSLFGPGRVSRNQAKPVFGQL